jgi:predicted DsbA family dithiol-disulfide isomerase
MVTTVTIWSDLHCPWSYVAIHRLRAARDAMGLDVVLDQRPWPLEWVNEEGTPRATVETEALVLAAHEPDLFARFDGASWPSTFLPAFELVAAARRALGAEAAEQVDYAVRRRFFRSAADVSLRHVLEQAARDAVGVRADAVMAAWTSQAVRADVARDFERSTQLGVEGSPHVIWPDGSSTLNPGISGITWTRGIPAIGADDPQEPARLLREHCTPAPRTA